MRTHAFSWRFLPAILAPVLAVVLLWASPSYAQTSTTPCNSSGDCTVGVSGDPSTCVVLVPGCRAETELPGHTSLTVTNKGNVLYACTTEFPSDWETGDRPSKCAYESDRSLNILCDTGDPDTAPTRAWTEYISSSGKVSLQCRINSSSWLHH